jgi:hypothetical protein
MIQHRRKDNQFQKIMGKLKMWWLGPFRVLTTFPNGSIQLTTLDGDTLPTCINGDGLKFTRPKPNI